MNYQYTPKHTNPYMHSTHQTSSKVPQTLFHPSPTPHKQTLQRNQSFQNRLYNQDLIQLIAKIRSLQDDLINQRFKTQSLQRKLTQYQKIIDNLQYELTEQSYQLQKYMHEIQLSNEKNLEILKYQQNLKIVGQEIQELNNILIMKNKDFDQISERNKQLEYEIKKFDEECHVLSVNQNIWKKEIDNLWEQCNAIAETVKGQTHRSIQQNTNNQQDFNNTQPNHFSASKSSHANRNQPNQDSLTFNFIHLNQDMTKKVQLIKGIITSLACQIKSKQKQHQQTKKQLSTSLIRQKQRFIKLQYDYKLLQERTKDTSKKQDLISSYYNEQKVQQIIEQLMKKQDDYIKRIEELVQENLSLKEEIQSIESNNEYFEKIDLQEKNSVIQNLKKENVFLEETNVELQHKLKSMEASYETIIAEKHQELQIQAQNAIKIAKKGRKIEEENYHYQIKIQELTGEVNMLKKEITILKGEYPEDEQQQ